jgi:hypothetical protein
MNHRHQNETKLIYNQTNKQKNITKAGTHRQQVQRWQKKTKQPCWSSKTKIVREKLRRKKPRCDVVEMGAEREMKEESNRKEIFGK